MPKSGKINRQLESIPHNQRPESGATSPWSWKLSKVCVSKGTKGKHMCFQWETMHSPVHVRDAWPPWGGNMHCQHCHHQTGRLLAMKRGSSGRKGEVSFSGRTVCGTCQGSTGAHPHLTVFVLGGYSTEILAQFFTDIFWRLPIRTLIKLPGFGGKKQ